MLVPFQCFTFFGRQTEAREPFIPLETELDQLISACGRRTATSLQILKDSAARAGEAARLKWTDIDEMHNTISISKAEKKSKPRTVTVSPKTIAMIKALPKKYGQYIFNPKPQTIKDVFSNIRNRLAENLQNPRLKQIHLHTFRHWKATMEYHRTKDILHVMRMLGHKNIANTRVYTHMIDFANEEYSCAVAENLDEAKKLIEAGLTTSQANTTMVANCSGKGNEMKHTLIAVNLAYLF